jgi:Na+(H+)/acetate symporter ActP
MDQRMPLWSVFLYGVLMLSVVVAAIMVAWREHVDAKAMLRRMKADDERWAADRQRQQRLAEIRDWLYLESLPEQRRA